MRPRAWLRVWGLPVLSGSLVAWASPTAGETRHPCAHSMPAGPEGPALHLSHVGPEGPALRLARPGSSLFPFSAPGVELGQCLPASMPAPGCQQAGERGRPWVILSLLMWFIHIVFGELPFCLLLSVKKRSYHSACSFLFQICQLADCVCLLGRCHCWLLAG